MFRGRGGPVKPGIFVRIVYTGVVVLLVVVFLAVVVVVFIIDIFRRLHASSCSEGLV